MFDAHTNRGMVEAHIVFYKFFLVCSVMLGISPPPSGVSYMAGRKRPVPKPARGLSFDAYLSLAAGMARTLHSISYCIK